MMTRMARTGIVMALAAALPGVSQAQAALSCKDQAAAAAAAGASVGAKPPPWALKGVALGSSVDAFRKAFQDVQCETFPDPKVLSCKATSTLSGGPATIEVRFLDGTAVWVVLEHLSQEQATSAQTGLMDKFGTPTCVVKDKIFNPADWPRLYSFLWFDQAVWVRDSVDMLVVPDTEFDKPHGVIYWSVVLCDHARHDKDWKVRSKQSASSASDI
ncbi:MAG: hypothetical protein JSS03_01210 [Proteobacteria bacterium]|nr:hypothetical protein [Pseudomonadota bacterium]